MERNNNVEVITHHCGIASTFGIIHCFGGEATITEINQHFKELYPDFRSTAFTFAQR
jgi:hypothetical protein